MEQQEQLHMVLFPAMAHGHMIPMLDMAKLFSSRGIRTTIITTPAFTAPVTKAQQSAHDIGLTVLPFPPEGSSLPAGITSFDQLSTPDLVTDFFRAMDLLQGPLEALLRELNPHCLVSDMFLPWTDDSAAKFRIPRLVFYGTSCFSRCLTEQMRLQKPYNNVSSDSEPFALAGLPHQLNFVRSQISPFDWQDEDNAFTRLIRQISESASRTYGEIVNSFYELESPYLDHFKNVLGRKAWPIGPLLLCNASNEKGEGKKSQRGKESAIDEVECLAWLDSKSPNSVVYVCFGSTATFSKAQLHETAAGLEASAQDFIWVVKKGKNQQGDEDLLPQGFEERVKGKGLIIRGWAPQLMILDHHAIGAFVTHCGWNSTLEGISAGVPMITWPVFAEQFYNEKLVTEVLKTGVSVGNKRWMRMDSEGVGRDAVAEVVKQVMVGGGAAEMRSRAEYYKETAKKAVEEGGSSYNSLNALIEELNTFVPPTKHDIN